MKSLVVNGVKKRNWSTAIQVIAKIYKGAKAKNIHESFEILKKNSVIRKETGFHANGT